MSASLADPDLARREAATRRLLLYRDRKRRGVMVVQIEVAPKTIAGLEQLGLLPRGERDSSEVAAAVNTFLNAAGPVAAVGNAKATAEAKGMIRFCRWILWHPNAPAPSGVFQPPAEGWRAFRRVRRS